MITRLMLAPQVCCATTAVIGETGFCYSLPYTEDVSVLNSLRKPLNTFTTSSALERGEPAIANSSAMVRIFLTYSATVFESLVKQRR